jgi:hypothetical protein
MDKKFSFEDIVGATVRTPAGLIVSQDAFEGLVKSAARQQMKQERNNQPLMFSPYAIFNNMRVHGAREKPMGTPQHDQLYEAADKSFIDQIIIQARVDQSKMVWQKAIAGKQLGFKVVHDRSDDPSFKPSKSILDRCAEMEKILGDPTPDRYKKLYPDENRPHPGLKDLISRLVRSELIIDRKVLYRQKNRNGKGYGYFHFVPSATIKPVSEAVKIWRQKNDPLKRMNMRQIFDKMGALSGYDLYDKDFVQLMDGQIMAAFTADEISIHIANPSDRENRMGYGTSRLEISLDLTNTALYAWQYNQELFKTNYPEAVLSISGDYNKEGLDRFKQQMLGETGPGSNWRLPVIASEPGADLKEFKVEAHKLRDTPKDMLFDQFLRMLVNLKAAAYGAHPSIINFGMESGGGSGSAPLSGYNPKDEIEKSEEHWLKPHLMDMCAWLTDAIVKPMYDDLKLIIEGLDPAADKARLDITLEKGKAYMTRNDMRMADDLEPKGFWVPNEEYAKLSDEDKQKYDTNPWNYPNDVAIPSYLSSFQQAAMAEQMNEQPGQGGDEEDPDAMPDAGGEDSPWDHQPEDEQGSNPWGDEEDQGEADTGKENQPPLQKSQPEVKFLRITVD